MDTYYYAKSRNGSHLLQTLKTRSELIEVGLGTNHYAYSYDNIGNRKTAQELAEESTYEAKQLNQYSKISQGTEPFIPTFDADGNQTLIKTTTGIWSVVYNADNRPISFTQSQGDQSTIIECDYDYIGRRYTKKVTSNGTVSLHQRYIYRGYLQIACVDLTRSGHPALWYITWDPTEPVATRPLAIQKNATWYSYSHDLTKNVTELYQSDGLIATSYDYSPYGAVTAEGIDQALQWSSEYHDPELALTYYNYRHYNPTDGRWINRDPLGEMGAINIYDFVYNSPFILFDILGMAPRAPKKEDCSYQIDAGHYDVINEEEKEFEKQRKTSSSHTICDKYYGISCFRTPDGSYLWPTQESKDYHSVQRKKPDGTNAPVSQPSNPLLQDELLRVIPNAEQDAVKECTNKDTCCDTIKIIVSCRKLDPSITSAYQDSRIVRLACSYTNTYTCQKGKKQGK